MSNYRKRQKSCSSDESNDELKKKKQFKQATLISVPEAVPVESTVSSPYGKELWNKVFNFGSDYKKQVVEALMKPSIIERETKHGTLEEFRECYCPRPHKQCKKKGLPILAKKMQDILISSVIW